MMKKLNHTSNDKPIAKVISVKENKKGIIFISEKLPHVKQEDYEAAVFFANNGFPIKHWGDTFQHNPEKDTQ